MKRIHLFLVGILFLLCLVPLSQACSDDSPEIPVPPTPENPDPPTATWKISLPPPTIGMVPSVPTSPINY